MVARHFKILFAAALISVVGVAAQAKDLIIGSRADPAIDPHYQWLSTNVAYSQHIFDSLVRKDAKAQWLPSLAVSWKAIDNLTWEMSLRKGVKFHDGSPFTADDVLFSFDRLSKVPNNPNPYTANVRGVKSIEKIDDHTIRIHTAKPNPLMMGPISNFFIVSKKVSEGASTQDFRTGKAAIGTGPYKFVSYNPGSELVVARNDDYWGEKEPWDKVRFKIIPNDQARVAALLGGDIDVIDFPPPTEVPAIEKNPNTVVFKSPSDRVIYLILDVGREDSPYVFAKDGSKIKNPMMDKRVRLAMSMAINRDAIVSRVMGGLAERQNQYIPKGFVGYNPDLPELEYNPEKAKKLLAEAGYPDGFALTVHCSNNRYVNDAKLCEVVGQMLTRIGIAMKVETMPKNIFFPKIATYKKVHFSLILIGWGNSSTGTAGPFLTSIFHTPDKKRRMGHANRAHYDDPAYDKMGEDAVQELDPEVRAKKMRDAMAYIVDKMVGIPMHTQYVIIGTRKGLVATPRVDENTIAMAIRPAK
jgi:peptide/nickel transport system substrate-binding protein